MPGLKGLKDTRFKVTHRTPKPVFCPVCRSHKVKIKESYGILPQMYHCEDCGYEGTLILELEEEE
ncbi:hypothetical protein JXL21_00685 [Candidatus Bathyarchaeota archaeon]|nr:hypothetical protein [Candidatus Bathyarchaeota archaeon]